MFGDIDKNLKPYEYRLFLCKPDRTTIAELSEAFDKVLILNFGGIHELQFKIPFKIEKNKQLVRNNHVDLIRGHYLIRLERKNKDGYFIDKEYFLITKPKNVAQDGKEVKEVQCYFLPYEIRDKIIRNYEGTKTLVEALSETLEFKTDWTVEYIDASLANKYRTFSESQTNLLDFVFKLCETFDVIAIWNTINKTVGFYKQNSYGQDKGLTIQYGKYLKAIDEEPDFDNVVTRLYCYGQDGLSIRRLNPAGTDFIEDFSYYIYPFQRDENGNVIQHSKYMSDSLCNAILNYNALLEVKTGEFNNLLLQKETLQQNLIVKENELQTLQNELYIIQDNIDIAQASGQDTTQLLQDETNKQIEINTKQSEIDQVNIDITNIDNQILVLRNEIAVENNFTPEQITERNKFIKEQIWVDNNYVDDQDLYNDGKIKLEKLSQPLISYKIDVVDFLQVVESQRDWEKLVLGDIITINYFNFNISIKAKIITIEHAIDDYSLNLTIANTKDIKNGFLVWKDIFKQVISTSTQVDMSKFKWDNIENVETEVDLILNNVWEAAKHNINAGVNESVEITRRGITIKDPNDPNKFVRMMHGVIGFTNDGGNTFKLALDASGVYAERLVGKIILGNQLYITGTNGILEIKDNLLTIKDNLNNLRTMLGEYAPNKYGLLLKDKTGNKTILDEDGILQTWQEGRTDNVDSTHPLILNIYIPSETRSISKVILRFKLEAFRAYETGAASGGGSTQTSTSGGGTTATSTQNGGTDYWTDASAYRFVSGLTGDNTTGDGDHSHSYTFSGHSHVVTINGVSYETTYDLKGTITTTTDGYHGHGLYNHGHHIVAPAHTHDVTIPDHSHNVSIPSHTHGIVYGIYTGTLATGITVKINGIDYTTVLGGPFSVDQASINIAPYLSIGQWNIIELGSSQLGRIDATIFIQTLMGV